MRGKADATGRVAAQAEWRSARGDQRRLAAARSTRSARQIVRIVGAAVDQVVCFEREEQIGEVRTGEGHCAGTTQSMHERGIVRGTRRVTKTQGASAAARTRHFDRVLDGKGNAVERTQLFTALASLVGR